MNFMEGQKTTKYDFRKKRQEFSSNLRKSHRNQIFKKNRMYTKVTDDYENHEQNYIIDSRYEKYIRKFIEAKYHVSSLRQFFDTAHSDDPIKKHYGTIAVRKILSVTENPPIQDVIDIGFIPKLIQYAQQQQFPQLQLEAAWALTNVASGTHQQCQSIVDKGVIKIFVKLLQSNHISLIEQAVWAIGNFATDSTKSRDQIIRLEGIQNMIQVIKNSPNEYIYYHSLWALSNLCRGVPIPPYQSIRNGVVFFYQLLIQDKIQDQQTLNDVIWALSLNLDNKNIDDLFRSGFHKLLPRYLESIYTETVMASVRILIKITSGSYEQLSEAMNVPKMFDTITDLVGNEKKPIRIQACKIIANIILGKSQLIQTILRKQELMTMILNLFETDAAEVKSEICIIFSNIAVGGPRDKVFEFFKKVNIVKYYFQLLRSDHKGVIKSSLSQLFEILRLGQRFKKQGEQNPFVLDILNEGDQKYLEHLQFHDDKQVYELVLKLIQTFFDGESQNF